MPIYKENDANTIIVPDSSGVLSDDQYASLSPSSYRLDEVRDQFNSIKESINRKMEEFSSLYGNNVRTVEEDLGSNFFSVNNQSMGIVDYREEFDRKKILFEKFTNELDDIIEKIHAINKKLTEVELALKSMNDRYHVEEEQIIEMKNQYFDHLQNEPQKYNYDNSYDYDLDHTSWGQQLRIIIDSIDEKESQLREKCHQTKNRITVSWYCEERGG